MILYFRYIALLCLLIALHFSLLAQNADDILDKRISIEVQDLSLKKILEKISMKTGIDFSYSDDLIQLPEKVNIKATDKTLRAILDQLLSGYNLQYVIIGNQIVFQPRKKGSGKHTISGYISDFHTGERLISATLYDSLSMKGISTNEYGYYSITLSDGPVHLRYSYVGYSEHHLKFSLSKDTVLSIGMMSNNQLKQVVVSYNQNNINNKEPGTEHISIQNIKTVPNIFGESDLIRTLQFDPGVKGQDFSNFYVRGGNSDQNLILLDDAIVYKYSHIGGLFSVFNTDALKNVDLYKGLFRPSYGGRLSSVLDVRMREGNNQNFEASGSIGILFSHFTIEGPIKKNKISFICSARRSYFDIFLHLFSSTKGVKAYFLDFNGKLNYIISDKSRLYLSYFNSADMFNFPKDGSCWNYHNRTLSAKYNYAFSSKLFSNVILTYTMFGSEYLQDENSESTHNYLSTKWSNTLTDYNFRNDYTWYVSPMLTVSLGAQFLLHKIRAGGNFQVYNDSNKTTYTSSTPLPSINSLENAIYINSDQKITDKLSVEYGIRLSMYGNIGKSIYYMYSKNQSGKTRIKDTITYKSGQIYNTHFFAEPRLTVCYTPNKFTALKVGYNRNIQNIHLFSNTALSLPFDIFYPTTINIKPQLSDIVSAGCYLEFNDHKYSSSVEVYYKKMQNVVDYIDNANLIGNQAFENELSFGNARSYGVELCLRKNKGLLTGWIAYTYSKALMKIANINNGTEYPANWDIPHDFSTGLVVKASKRVTLSATWVYNSGAPTMLPVGAYRYADVYVPYYTGRNKGRLTNYQRLDISMNIITRNSMKRKAAGKKFESSWNFSIYNVYNHLNATHYEVHHELSDTNKSHLYAASMFGLIPSISYSFKF